MPPRINAYEMQNLPPRDDPRAALKQRSRAANLQKIEHRRQLGKVRSEKTVDEVVGRTGGGWPLAGRLLCAGAEVIGGALVSFASQVDAPVRGPLANLQPSHAKMSIIAMATIGGVLVGTRQFSKLPKVLIIDPMERGKTRAAGNNLRGEGEAEQALVKFHGWQAARELVKMNGEVAESCLSIALNLAAANLLAWDGGSLGASLALTGASVLTTLLMAETIFPRILHAPQRQSIVRAGVEVSAGFHLPPAHLPHLGELHLGANIGFDIGANDPMVAGNSAKKIEELYERWSPLNAIPMAFALGATLCGISVGLARQHHYHPGDFTAYTQGNMMPAILNFVALGCALIGFADLMGKRAKAVTLAEGEILAGERHVSQQLLTTLEGVHTTTATAVAAEGVTAAELAQIEREADVELQALLNQIVADNQPAVVPLAQMARRPTLLASRAYALPRRQPTALGALEA